VIRRLITYFVASNLFLITLYMFQGFALELVSIKLIGNTVDIGQDALFRDRKGLISSKELESISVDITNAYHKKGYTTSYVEKLIMRKDGILEIHVRESRILGLKVTGIDDSKIKEIKSLLVPEIGTLYNKFDLEGRVRAVKEIFKLKTIRIDILNYKDTGDVFLSVQVEKRGLDRFFGGIGFEPIYGVSPQIGYLYNTKKSAVRLLSSAGYRDGDFRKLTGELKYWPITARDGRPGIFMGIKSERLIETWESQDKEYKTTSVCPFLGITIPFTIYRLILFDAYLLERVTRLFNYDYDEYEYDDYDTRITVRLWYSDRFIRIRKRETTDIRVSVSGGRSRLSNEYWNSTVNLKSSLSPFVWMRLVPMFIMHYTSSDERFSWHYVFDRNLPGFFDDFTASSWKNVAGLYCEFEISPEFFYIGPFANSGYFLDEDNNWKLKSGGGIKGEIYYQRLHLQIYYAYDLSSSPSEGGFYITASSKF